MGWITLASFVITVVIWLWAILRYDRYEREPIRAILYVFIIGGFLSSFFAGLFNQGFAHLIGYQFSLGENGKQPVGMMNLFMAFVGFNEESCKALLTLMLIRKSKKFNEPVDALIYSMTVAFGFAVAENIDYTAQFGLKNFFFRQFTAVPLHVGLAAIWGMGLAKAKFISNGNYLLNMLPYLLVAALIHYIYNSGISMIRNDLAGLLTAAGIAFVVMIYARKKLKFYEEESPFSNRLFCHNCNTSNTISARYCKQCGKSIRLRFYNLCGSCNNRVSKTATYCPHCGNLIR